MAEDVQGFFRMLANSPKTVSLAAGVACAVPYFLRERLGLPPTYMGIFAVASVFFLMLFVIQSVIVGVAFVRQVVGSRRATIDKFKGLTAEELDTLAVFVVQEQLQIYFPGASPVLRRLYGRGMLTTIHTNAPIQNFELEDWAWDVLKRHPTLLKGLDGTRVRAMSEENLAAYKRGDFDRFY